MRILHLIDHLGLGGAQAWLLDYLEVRTLRQPDSNRENARGKGVPRRQCPVVHGFDANHRFLCSSPGLKEATVRLVAEQFDHPVDQAQRRGQIARLLA